MKKTTTCAALALAALFAFAGCAPNKGAEQIPSSADTETESAGFEEISPEEAKELIGEANVVLLDVRTQEEYDEGHIEGAVLLPYDAITADSAGLPADKDATIIIYCRSGRRSAIAAETLLGLGYTRVYDLGGIQSWPYAVVK